MRDFLHWNTFTTLISVEQVVTSDPSSAGAAELPSGASGAPGAAAASAPGSPPASPSAAAAAAADPQLGSNYTRNGTTLTTPNYSDNTQNMTTTAEAAGSESIRADSNKTMVNEAFDNNNTTAAGGAGRSEMLTSDNLTSTPHYGSATGESHPTTSVPSTRLDTTLSDDAALGESETSLAPTEIQETSHTAQGEGTVTPGLQDSKNSDAGNNVSVSTEGIPTNVSTWLDTQTKPVANESVALEHDSTTRWINSDNITSAEQNTVTVNHWTSTAEATTTQTRFTTAKNPTLQPQTNVNGEIETNFTTAPEMVTNVTTAAPGDATSDRKADATAVAVGIVVGLLVVAAFIIVYMLVRRRVLHG